ncbi:MAG: TetR/AcrR family transcriptional regulator, partial [Pseudomonadota bacterium]
EGARLLAEKGVEGFSLRQIALRTGVTVAAPSHHFGSAKGLLTAIATEGFTRLATQLRQARETANDPDDAITAICRAYVETVVNDPGYARVMFRLDLLDPENEGFRTSAFAAFGVLKAALAKAVPEGVTTDQISTATKTLWATMHGLVALPMIEDDETEQVIRAAVGAQLSRLR